MNVFLSCAFRRRLFAVSALSLLSFPPALQAGGEAENGETKSPPSRLEKLWEEGDPYGFRIELGKLLEEPAKDFFSITERLFDPDNRNNARSMPPSAYQLVSPPDRSRFIAGASDKIKRMTREELAMSHVLLPPLGKQDRHGLTPSAAAARSGNDAAAGLFRLYEASDHEIYDSEKNTVWEANPEIYPSKEDNIWRRFPQTPLEETAVGQALLRGDFNGFLKALNDLYEGPAWKVIALLHSRETKTRKTVFHLSAEALFTVRDLVKSTVFSRLKAKGQSNEAAEKNSRWLSDNIEKRRAELKNENDEAAQKTSVEIYSYISQIKELSFDEQTDFLTDLHILGAPDAEETEALSAKNRRFKAAKALGSMIEAVVPTGMPVFRKEKDQAEEVYLQGMLFTGTAGVLSLVSSVASFGMDQNVIGAGLAVLSGWTFSRCRRVFQSYKSLKSNRRPPSNSP